MTLSQAPGAECQDPGLGIGGGPLAQAGGPHTSPVPGMTVMVFRARSTRKVLRAEILPKSTNSVRYLGRGDEVKAVSE